MQEVLTDFLQRRKNRAIAIVMGVKERECDPDLSAMASQKLRKVVLDQFNDLYDACVDVLDSLDTGEVVLNENYLEKLNEIHSAIISGNGGNRGHAATTSRSS